MYTTYAKCITLTAMALMIAVSSGFQNVSASEPDWEWTDARREGAIWSSFALNPHLNPFSLDIEVSDGEATLHGTVDEDITRDLAEEIALSVDGVDSVDNNIDVEPDHIGDEEAGRRTFEQTVTDATASTAVKSKLLWNQNLEGLEIQVDTQEGVTTLSGVVGSEEERDLAAELARNTRGVDEVHNELTVETGLERPAEEAGAEEEAVDETEEAISQVTDTLSDGWISTKVKGVLLFTKSVPGRAIRVSTTDGVVELTGVVDSSSERDLAVESAEGVRGVQDVDATNLKVRD
ncbi:MAG: BON domain-containing protein [Candidatus Hydrogenedentota bacterium]